MGKSIEVICPLYNAEKYIDSLHKSVMMQENVNLIGIHYILTESNDKTEEFLKNNNCTYDKITKSKFSHSLVREKAALNSKADIVAFITQDIVIERKDWLYYLTKDISDDNIVACYSRQISKYDNIEKYTRERNYPDKSSVVSKNDIDKLRLRTFFFSDASSAINRNVFVKLNGYDNKNLPISEDMYIAYKIIMNGYKIKYCADSVVYHSHKFTLKQQYKRYYDTGRFFKQNDYLNKYKVNQAGGNLAKYVLKRAWDDRNWKVLFNFIPNMLVRFMGMKLGKIGLY